MRFNSKPCRLIFSNGQAGLHVFCFSILTFLVVGGSVLVPLSALQEVDNSLAIERNRIVETIEVARIKLENTPIRILHEDLEVISRRLDSADSPEQKLAAWIDLCGLYLVIVSDSRYQNAETLQGYRGRIARRLQLGCKELKQDPDDTATTEQSTFIFSPEFASAIVDPHWDLMSHHTGASGVVSYHASGLHGSNGHFLRGMQAGEPFDNGPELVALIEAILHPDFWNVAGGAGTLHYFRPLRILVVRATTTVHEDLTDFLERLR